MKIYNKFLLGALITLFGGAMITQGATLLFRDGGGTGTSSPSGILYGDNGVSTALKTVTIGSNLTFTGGTLSATGGTGESKWASSTDVTSIYNIGLGSVGVGTTTPPEKLSVWNSTGYTTIRTDSGNTRGQFFANNGADEVVIGSKSASVFKLMYGNAIRAQLYEPTNAGTIFQVDAPSGNPQESTLTTKRDFGSGNFQGTDWTNEDFGVDAFTSINSYASGTKSVLPILLRGWRQSDGQIHATGKPIAFFDPNQGSSAIGNFASTTGVAVNKYPTGTILSVGASTTAPRAFSVYTNDTVSDTGLAFSVQQNGTWLGVGANPLAYASSTNGATLFGITAGGGNATTSATVSGTTAFGHEAAYSLAGGLNNTAIGYRALRNATTSAKNTAVGYLALQSSASLTNTTGSNTAIGYSALAANGTGIQNTAVGTNALLTNTSASNNSAFGLNALQLNSTGAQQSAFGMSALLNSTADDNTCFGYSCLLGNTNGTKNVALGREAGNFNQTGTDNVFIGYRSGFGVSANSHSKNVMVGEFTGNAVTTGSGNVLAGFQAGKSLTSGASNIVIGQNVDVPVITGNGQLNIGNVLYGTGLYNDASNLSSTAVAAGKIGVGTSTPTFALSAAGVEGANGTVVLGLDTTAKDFAEGGSMINFAQGGQSTAQIKSTTGSGNATPYLSFLVSLDAGVPSERMRIDENGFVGIGTTTPQKKLVVQGADNGIVSEIHIPVASASITTADTFMNFTSTGGSIGDISGTAVSGTIIYNTFTGSHWSKIDDMSNVHVGDLLETTGETIEGYNEHLTKSRLACRRGSKTVYGVYGGTNSDGKDTVLSIGAGKMKVTNKGEDIEAGDLLMASNECGKAERQKRKLPWYMWALALKFEEDDGLISNITAGKAMENVLWEEGETSREVAVIYLGG